MPHNIKPPSEAFRRSLQGTFCQLPGSSPQLLHNCRRQPSKQDKPRWHPRNSKQLGPRLSFGFRERLVQASVLASSDANFLVNMPCASVQAHSQLPDKRTTLGTEIRGSYPPPKRAASWLRKDSRNKRVKSSGIKPSTMGKLLQLRNCKLQSPSSESSWEGSLTPM